MLALILWLLGAILVVGGIIALVRGQAVVGVVLILVGLLVAPGAVNVFT